MADVNNREKRLAPEAPIQQSRPQRSLLRRTAFVSRTGVGASGAGCPLFSTTTSTAIWTIGIRPSLTASPRSAKSLSSTMQASPALPVTCPPPSQAWRRIQKAFIDAVELKQIDFLGFFMGAMVA